VQQLRRRLELLMLDQPPHERLARILLGLAPARRRLGAGQQHLRLDVNQRRRHDQELAGDVEIQLLHQLDVREVLLRDSGDRNVVHIHLVDPDEVYEEIERPFERFELDLVCVRRRFEVIEMFSQGTGLWALGSRAWAAGSSGPSGLNRY
jgi:hypothetical protein